MRPSFSPTHLPPPQIFLNRLQQQQQLNNKLTNTHSSFTMLFPPPNITGRLHMGHALTVLIQDAQARFQRMNGHDVKWIYGLDHAGIATQAVVEKRLLKQQQQQHHHHLHHNPSSSLHTSLNSWYEQNKIQIKTQLINLGASLDYNNEYFTLDNTRSLAVKEAFIRLFNKGLIYRAKRMIHWCPRLQTTISDLEVDKEQINEPTTIDLFGEKVLVGVTDDLPFKIVGQEHITLTATTTRLETLFGDVAIAVHPRDPNKAKYIGHYVWHPIISGVKLPIVGDETLVNMEIGTGVVKITPCHDENDYLCAQRLSLPLGHRVIRDDGTMCPSHVPEPFAGMSRFQARNALRKHLQLPPPKRFPMLLLRCSRSGDVLEPCLKPQFFVRMKTLAESALENMKQNKLQFFPPHPHQEIWESWLSDCRDWCISRQIRWGHPIPAYRLLSTNLDDDHHWIAAHDMKEAMEKLHCLDEKQMYQDQDVLDTWFSSALLPLSAQGWPIQRHVPSSSSFSLSDDEDHHHHRNNKSPLSLMETGSDILFFWVARMVMLCQELDEEQHRLPFSRVFLHGMVKDIQGRKMSKSLGNVIDPNDVIAGISLTEMLENLKQGNLPQSEIERASKDLKLQFPQGIPACGVDGLRIALASYANPSSPHVCFDAQRAEQGRIFCNKIWQAVRFVIGKGYHVQHDKNNLGLLSIESSWQPFEITWLSHRLAVACEECLHGYQTLDYERVWTSCKQLLVNDLCDVMIELCKGDNTDLQLLLLGHWLVEGLITGLKLLHPIAPFVTEELWHELTHDDLKKSLSFETFPTITKYNTKQNPPHIQEQFEFALEIVRAVRALKKRLGLSGLEIVQVKVYVENLPQFMLEKKDEINHVAFKLLRTVENIEWVVDVVDENPSKDQEEKEPIQVGNGGFIVITNSNPSTNNKTSTPSTSNRKKIEEINVKIESLQLSMNSKEFIEKAPLSVQEKTKNKLAQLLASKEILERKNVS
jgi:valyl-tRNA synthetase